VGPRLIHLVNTTDIAFLCINPLPIAGQAPDSVAALASLRAIREEYAPEDCSTEAIDVLDDPQRALEDRVFVAPTLVRLSRSLLRIVGSPSEFGKVTQLLGLERRES
jgi:circadian clock protein KaiB